MYSVAFQFAESNNSSIDLIIKRFCFIQSNNDLLVDSVTARRNNSEFNGRLLFNISTYVISARVINVPSILQPYYFGFS